MDELNQNYYRFDFEGIIGDIASARLYDLGFEAFEEKESSIEGYIPELLITPGLMEEILGIHPFLRQELIRQQNWNAIWESSFEPITIADTIHIRATFHAPAPLKHEIIIDPKMAFGTGHHATTRMVLEEMLKLDFKGNRVLDFGCGSGILAIAAEKLGATDIDAIDYDIWSVENTNENIILNQCSHIHVAQADQLSHLDSKSYDIILANITRDILVKNTEDIIRLLVPSGIAIYSGFIDADLQKIINLITAYGGQDVYYARSGDWCVLKFRKK